MSVESLSFLQLYRINLDERKQNGMVIIDPVRGGKNSPDRIKHFQMMEYYDNEGNENVQYNVTFSQPFGMKLSYTDEENFLEN